MTPGTKERKKRQHLYNGGNPAFRKPQVNRQWKSDDEQYYHRPQCDFEGKPEILQEDRITEKIGIVQQ